MKAGTRVKMSETLKAKLRGKCVPGKHLGELMEEGADDCMLCSTAHLNEFGDCEGIVIGPMYPDWEEVDVRWQPSNLRYGYHPDDLVEVKETT